MSEAYNYGGNGSLKRVEYNELNAQAMGVYAEKASDEIEYIFLNSPGSLGATSRFSQDEEGMYRNFTSAFIIEGNSTLIFDRDNGSLVKTQQASGFNTVNIEQALYLKGTLHEECVVKFEQSDPGANGVFSTRYHFSHYSGGHWQSSVEHIDVANDDFNMIRRQNNSKYYSREMTPYDFDEFFEDTTEINTQLRIRLVQ